MARRDLTGAVDFDYLETYALKDWSVIDEVLDLFQQQVALWTPLLDPAHDGWRDAAHTLKGAAGGIGAHEVKALAEAAEKGDETGAAQRLGALKDGLDRALFDVAAYRHELQIKSLKS